jgi:hypothetical protein
MHLTLAMWMFVDSGLGDALGIPTPEKSLSSLHATSLLALFRAAKNEAQNVKLAQSTALP